MSTHKLTRIAVVAALYATLTIALAPISYGAIQFRISEALCILPLLFPETTISLTIGCFIANLIAGNGALDIVLGPVATCCACLISLLVRRWKIEWIGLAFTIAAHVVFNAVLVPLTFLAVTELKEAYLAAALSVGLGQGVVLVFGGTILYFVIKKLKDKYSFLSN